MTILGHVSKPGCFKVEKGTPLSEVIDQAKPKSYANLLRFSPTERVEIDRSYVIEKFEEISVFVEGACEPVELRVPPGTRLCDLKGLLQLKPNADLATFKKRRCLKDKEIVKIALKSRQKKGV